MCLGALGQEGPSGGMEEKTVNIGVTVECAYRVVAPRPWVREEGLCHSQRFPMCPHSGPHRVSEVSKNVAPVLKELTAYLKRQRQLPRTNWRRVSATKSKELLIHTTIRMALRNILLTGRSQTQQNAYSWFHLYETLEKANL